MATIHFLNVGNGDCNLIEHDSGHLSVIDINFLKTSETQKTEEAILLEKSAVKGNFNQSAHPTNPIDYIQNLNYRTIFRFILTHPDEDHFNGIENLFNNFKVINFWDINHNKEGSDNENWKFYKKVQKRDENPKVLNLYTGSKGCYYNLTEENQIGGDGLYILSPDKELVDIANETNDYNDCSYVILFINQGKKIIFAGDSHDNTWNKILVKSHPYRKYINNIDVLIAPHHGRKSDRDFSFLEVLKPKLTLLGNAKSNNKEYNAYKKYGEIITNEQAGNIILKISTKSIRVYIENKNFVKSYCNINDDELDGKFNSDLEAYYIKKIK